MAKRLINRVVIHTSDSSDDLDIGFKQINEWHKQRGFLSPSGIHCGYHWIVRRDGRVEKGRPESEIGAHANGHNSTSIAIVWVGRKAPSSEQYEALLKQIRDVCDRYGVPVDRVVGHKELSPDKDGDGVVEPHEWIKTCPNLDCDRLRADLLFTKGKS